MSETIAETERGHRRGVVLGFTMAELLLLLLFCLLLISATALLDRDKEINALREQLDATTGIPETRCNCRSCCESCSRMGYPN